MVNTEVVYELKRMNEALPHFLFIEADYTTMKTITTKYKNEKTKYGIGNWYYFFYWNIKTVFHLYDNWMASILGSDLFVEMLDIDLRHEAAWADWSETIRS